MNYRLCKGDIPEDFLCDGPIGIDTETMGLNLHRDRLCLVQLSNVQGQICLVQFPDGQYDAPLLKRLLSDSSIVKIMHFARFDIAAIHCYLGVLIENIFCTKLASRLARTFTDRHGLRDLVRDLLGAEISKQQQTSDWGQERLTQAQMEYAASDVLYLHALRDKLQDLLCRVGRVELAQKCFEFLPYRALLDLEGWNDIDILAHK